MQNLRLEEYTVNHIMTEGFTTEKRFSPELVAILTKATRNEGMDACVELRNLEDDGQEHYYMPENSEYIPVTQWCSEEEETEPQVWSIFMFNDPVTKSTRMIGWICDSHCEIYLRKIV